MLLAAVWEPSPRNQVITCPIKYRKPLKMGSIQEYFVGSIDQGTTSSRFLIFNKSGEPVASHQLEFKQIYPQPG
jgi:hypothetical protein